MFTTIGSFSAVYFTLAAVLFILILFEKHFIRLEDKIKARKSATKRQSGNSTTVKSVQKNKNIKNNRNTSSVHRLPKSAA